MSEKIREAIEKKEKNKGRKRIQNKLLWKKEQRKILRNSGEAYINNSNILQNEKVFKCVDECCGKQCFSKIPVEKQLKLFNNFWQIGEYNKQNLYLRSFMEIKIPKITRKNRKNMRNIFWTYKFDDCGVKTQVCKKFLLKNLQLSDKRLRVIQSKIVNDEPLDDKRGKNPKSHKIPGYVYQMFEQMLSELPVINPNEKKKKKYFQDQTLNLQKIHRMFLDYHYEKTGQPIKISLTVISNHFNKNCNYSLQNKQPKIDNYNNKSNSTHHMSY